MASTAREPGSTARRGRPPKAKSTGQTIGFHLTERQVEVNELLGGPQRHTALIGGSRSGKTFLICRAILVRAARYPGSRHGLFRQRANAARASLWLDTVRAVRRKCFPNLNLDDQRQDGYIQLDNGSEVWIGGLDDAARVEKILGLEFATLFFNECSQIALSSVTVALSRLAQNIPGLKQRAFYDLNPVGKGHWTYQQFIRLMEGDGRKALRDPDNYKHTFVNPRDNAPNLTKEYLDSLANLPERQRRRFYDGIYVDEVEGALWTLELLERAACGPEDVPVTLRQVVVAVDPSGTSGKEDKRSDMVGIVVAARGDNGIAYVLADLTCNEPPEKWGAIVAKAFRDWRADHVTAETNFGGDMVRFVIQTADGKVPVHVVHASRGKAVRAEPVSALYGSTPSFPNGRVRHVKYDDSTTGPRRHGHDLVPLEDELISFSAAGYMGERSPNRADALVWALTDIMLLGDDGAAIATPIIITGRRVPLEDQPLQQPLLNYDEPRPVENGMSSLVNFGDYNDITERRGW